MLPHNLIFALASAGLISALPLNINLGAYSPALVVGDGEISFGGAQSAGELMETLASGAATSAQSQGGNAAAQPSGEAAAQAEPGVTSGPNPALSGQSAAPAPSPAPKAEGNDIIPEQPQAAVVDANPNDDSLVGGMISKGLEPSLKIPSNALPRPNMEKRTAEKRDMVLVDRDILKREINGFNAALNYAINAAKNQPEVELGTGREGSGVGVIVNPGVSVPAGSPAAGQRPAGEAAAPAKRYVMPGAAMGATAEQPKSGITLMAIAEI